MRWSEELFGSKTRIKLLRELASAQQAFSVRELARACSLPKSTTARIVDDWQKKGLVNVRLFGRLKAVQLNASHALVSPMRALFSREEQFVDDIVQSIRADPALASKDVVSVVLFGSLARRDIGPSSDADILAVTARELDSDHVVHGMWDRLHVQLPLLPSVLVMTAGEVKDRVRQKDAFIAGIWRQGKVLKGDDWFESVRQSF